jgi:tetratricopeptide (TPR) repeat protein
MSNKALNLEEQHVGESESDSDLLDSTADEFFDTTTKQPTTNNEQNIEEQPCQPDPFPLRRIRPLIPDREKADGNIEFDDDKSSLHQETSLEKANACKENGNKHFAFGELDIAANYYTDALRLCPKTEECLKERSIYYCNRAACALALSPPRYEDAIYDCDRALELKPDYAKALARRSQALEATNALDEALLDQQALVKVLEGGIQAQKAISEVTRLQALVSDRDEKLKNEMLDKLKGLGNSLLGNFGLSLDNFKAVKDEKTGSYSISFQR